MINKIYKRIHSKYWNFFKFFFFLRYLFATFLIAFSLFLLIPKLFDYEKKQEIIKEYLINNYDLEINNYTSKRFNIFPLPNLSIKNVDLKVKDRPISLKAKNLKIFLNLKNIYNYENFNAKKIILSETELDLDIDIMKELMIYFWKLENNLDVNALNINLKQEDRSLFKIKEVSFSNYGYKKYKVKGKIFNKRFRAHLKNDNKDLNFKIFNTGVKADFKFSEKSSLDSISGSSKVRFLNNYLKFDFIFHDNQFEIIKSNFKNKNLSIAFDSIINFSPFFGAKSDINIKEINTKLFNKINLRKFLKNKKIIKKLSIDNTIKYSSKKYRNSLIKSYTSNSSLTYGRLVFLNKIFISGGDISCKGNSLLTEEYPRLNFFCLFNLKDKKKLFKKFSINEKININPIKLNIEGSLNLFNRKINLRKINIDETYIANETDKKYFKEIFETTLFDDGFFGIFRMNKLKEFLLEVI
tara:strand:+ start:295 stop:1698 length:1404 start_codon:yes stop_codon:yes gene_type:complete